MIRDRHLEYDGRRQRLRLAELARCRVRYLGSVWAGGHGLGDLVMKSSVHAQGLGSLEKQMRDVKKANRAALVGCRASDPLKKDRKPHSGTRRDSGGIVARFSE